MDERLRSATTVDGRPRFYPLGEHPATLRLRATLERALYLGFAEDSEFVVYLRDQIAAFEEGESIAKAKHLRYYGRRR